MVRDFTDETKERLLKQIDKINNETWNPVSDFLGDRLLYVGKWIGILHINDDMSNVKSYQKKVLDMTNMTKKELNEIFENVYSIDNQYKGLAINLNTRQSTYNTKLEKLIGMIQPNFNIPSAEAIKSELNEINKTLSNIDGIINKEYKDKLAFATKETALKSAKGLVGGVIGLAVDLFTLPVKMVKNVATRNPLAIFSDVWSLIDGVFSVGSNLVGLFCLFSFATGNANIRESLLSYTEPFAGVKGLTDALEADEKVNGKNVVTSSIKWLSKKIDALDAGYHLVKDLSGFMDNPSSMIDTNLGLKEEYKPIQKADMLQKYQKDGTWRTYQNLYRKLYKNYNYSGLSKIKKIYGYLESLWELPNGADVVVEKTTEKVVSGFAKIEKSASDLYDFFDKDFDNIKDLFYIFN